MLQGGNQKHTKNGNIKYGRIERKTLVMNKNKRQIGFIYQT